MAKTSEKTAPFEDQKETEYPTPVIGFPVNYYLKGDNNQESPLAALVTGIEGVGRIQLTVFRPGGHVSGVRAVYHCSMPNAEGTHSWHWVEGLPGKDQYRLARHEQARRKAQQAEAEIIQRATEERARRRREELTRMNDEDPVIPEAR